MTAPDPHRTTEIVPAQTMSTDRHSRDLSRGWLPVTVVVSIVLAAGALVWWVAGRVAAIETGRTEAAAAMKAAEAAMQRAATAESRAAAAEAAANVASAAVLSKLAGIEVSLQAVKAQNTSIEAQVAELRAAWVRRP